MQINTLTEALKLSAFCTLIDINISHTVHHIMPNSNWQSVGVCVALYQHSEILEVRVDKDSSRHIQAKG